MEDLKKAYFASKNMSYKKKFIGCWLLREHEYYVYRFYCLLLKEEQAKTVLGKSWCRMRKNILERKRGLRFRRVYLAKVSGCGITEI